MKKLISLIFLSLLIVSLIFISKLKSQQPKEEGYSDFYYAPGKIVIQFTREVSPVIPRIEYGIIQTGVGQVDYLCQRFKVHAMRRQFPAQKYPTPDLSRHFVVKFDESFNLDEVVSAFANIPFFIEKVEKVGIHRVDSVPNDDYFANQWYLNQGSDCDIDASEAWDIEKGSDNVILAIADTGVDYNHKDLNDNIWINWDEYSGTPNWDDDGNGYYDDIYGYDWYGDGEVPDNDPMPWDDHGTHCAGIAAAETNNDRGVAGIAGGWYPGQKGCRIMCLRIGYFDYIDMSNAASAIVYAIDNGATVINCSWRNDNSGGLGDAVDYAIQNGLLIVVAAGNDNSIWPEYLCSRTDCMSVAATNKNDQKASYSNYGAWVDVAAPGGEPGAGNAIYSTFRSDGYGWANGTSMAAPMVVGLAGLLKSKNPDWNREQIWDRIVKSAVYIGGQGLGSGKINAHYALEPSPPAAPSNLNATSTAWTEIELTWQDNSDNERGFKVERKTGASNFSEIAALNGNITTYTDNSAAAGTIYYYRIKAYNDFGDSYSNTPDALIPDTSPDPPSYLEGYFDWGNHQVELTWSDSSNNEQGFIVERRSEWEPSFREIGSVGPNVTTFYDPSVSWDTIYHYRIKVYNPRGYAYSEEVIVYVG